MQRFQISFFGLTIFIQDFSMFFGDLITLFLTAEQYPIMWIYHIFLIHSTIRGHLGYLQFLAIRNKMAKNTYVQVLVWTQVYTSFE